MGTVEPEKNSPIKGISHNNQQSALARNQDWCLPEAQRP